jgi:hypothetical protein
MTTYDIYFGIGPDDLSIISEGLESPEISQTSLIDILQYGEYNTSYYWRVDTINEYGVTEGDVWSFTTIAFDPPLPHGVTLDEDGNPTGNPDGLNFVIAIKKLVVAANNKIWYEDL